jgi:hypothetical protein
MKANAFMVVAPYIPVRVYRRFRGACCFPQQGDKQVARADDGGSKHLWNVSKLLPDYTTQQPWRQPVSRESFTEASCKVGVILNSYEHKIKFVQQRFSPLNHTGAQSRIGRQIDSACLRWICFVQFLQKAHNNPRMSFQWPNWEFPANKMLICCVLCIVNDEEVKQLKHAFTITS